MNTRTNVSRELSDLFFNHHHDNYESLFVPKDRVHEAVSRDQMLVAIEEDAKNFVEHYPQTCQSTTALDLVKDFMERM